MGQLNRTACMKFAAIGVHSWLEPRDSKSLLPVLIALDVIGMRNASVTKADGMAKITLKTSTIPGWPEYFKGFCSNADGACYGSTSAFRIIKFSRDGKIEKEAPCF